MEKVLIGKIVNAVGLKGELKVYCYTDRKERFQELEQLFVEDRLYSIQKVRYQGNVAILKLQGIDDRNSAEVQKNKGVYMDEADLGPLPEGSYYVRDLIGITAADEEEKTLGILSDVIQNSAQDLYEIKTAEGKTVLIPAVKEFILDINMEKRTMKVKLPEGLLDL